MQGKTAKSGAKHTPPAKRGEWAYYPRNPAEKQVIYSGMITINLSTAMQPVLIGLIQNNELMNHDNIPALKNELSRTLNGLPPSMRTQAYLDLFDTGSATSSPVSNPAPPPAADQKPKPKPKPEPKPEPKPMTKPISKLAPTQTSRRSDDEESYGYVTKPLSLVEQLRIRLKRGESCVTIIMEVAKTTLKGKGKQLSLITLALQSCLNPKDIMYFLDMDEKTLLSELREAIHDLQTRVRYISPELSQHEFFTRRHPGFGKLEEKIRQENKARPARKYNYEDEDEDGDNGTREKTLSDIFSGPEENIGSNPRRQAVQTVKKSAPPSPPPQTNSGPATKRPPQAVLKPEPKPKPNPVVKPASKPSASPPAVPAPVASLDKPVPKPAEKPPTASASTPNSEAKPKPPSKVMVKPTIKARPKKQIPGPVSIKQIFAKNGCLDEIQTGPWQSQRKGRLLKYFGYIVNNIHANAVSKNQFAVMHALMQAYPYPIHRDELIDIAYGPSQTGNRRERRLYSGITLFNNTFTSHVQGSERPVWYLESMQAYVLNIPRADIPDKYLEEMGADTFGPIMIARNAGRAWVNNTPIERMGDLTWRLLISIFDYKNQNFETSDLASAIYGEVTDKTLDATHKGMQKLRQKLIETDPDLGDRMITSSRYNGYRFSWPVYDSRPIPIQIPLPFRDGP